MHSYKRAFSVLMWLAACGEDASKAEQPGRNTLDADGASQGCLEVAEPVDVAKAAAMGVDLAALKAAVEAEYYVPLTWSESGDTGYFGFRTESASYALVRSTNDPDFQLNIAIQCADHVRVDARVALGTGDGQLNELVPALRLRASDQYAYGTVSFEAVALAGTYGPELGANQCFVGTQIDLSLSADGLQGSITDAVASTSCDDLDNPLAGVGAREAATFSGVGDKSCTPEQQLAKLQGTQSLDCGTVPATATREQYEGTRQCIIDALARGDAFHALKWEQGDDSSGATGFVSAGAGQPVTMIHYDSDPTGGGGPGASMSKRSCSTLVNNDANPSCADEYRYQLCLLCAEDEAAWQPLCRGPAERRPVFAP